MHDMAMQPQVGVSPAREPQVAQEIGRLDAAVQLLANNVMSLEARLAVVTRDEADQAKEMLSVPREAVVPTASAIRQAVDSIEASSERLGSLLARLEV